MQNSPKILRLKNKSTLSPLMPAPWLPRGSVQHLPDLQLAFYMSLACLLFVLQNTDAPIFFLYYPLICSENWLAQEIEFLINLFAENGQSNTVLEKVTKEYMNNNTSIKEKVNIETITNDPIVKLPWVLKLGPKLRKKFW